MKISGCAGIVTAAALYGKSSRPNILFCISDDQSWCHTSIAGDPVVKTPAFDRVAKEGILFNNSYTSCPSCAPSRASVLTGQDFWRLEEGGLLFGMLRKKFAVYPDILKKNGYNVGMTGKGYKPSHKGYDHCWKDPAGQTFGDKKCKPPKGIKENDYFANFEDFLKERDPEKPFCFWCGWHEPHRKYKYGIGAESGMNLKNVKVPPFLPDTEDVRNDICDYYFEIQWFDAHLNKMLDLLEKNGDLDITSVVLTSDNGMPFPRAKATAYQYGVHMPLAIRWSRGINKPGRKVDDLISHVDFAPTFLEAAGLKVPPEMTGKSLMNIFISDRDGQVDKNRTMAVCGIERHVWCRAEGKTYPRRAVYTRDYVYILNYEPGRWPMGEPDKFSDTDGGPSKNAITKNKDELEIKEIFTRAFGKLPEEELYNINKDPYQLKNLAENPELSRLKKDLRSKMKKYQEITKDPRLKGEAPWDDYPFFRQGKLEYLKGKYLEEYKKYKGIK